jgi:hypothetical protein
MSGTGPGGAATLPSKKVPALSARAMIVWRRC